MKFTPHRTDGVPMAPIPARRFSMYIDNCRYWFAVHRSLNRHCYSVSHWDSGKKVADIDANSICAALGDEVLAAKGAIDKLIARVGGNRVSVVLNAAIEGVAK